MMVCVIIHMEQKNQKTMTTPTMTTTTDAWEMGESWDSRPKETYKSQGIAPVADMGKFRSLDFSKISANVKGALICLSNNG